MRVVVPNPSLIILCGPASAGKSTFAQRNFSETEIVSSDRCRAMISDDESRQDVSANAFDLFHHIIDARLRFRRLTVADSTALHPDARSDLRRLTRRRKIPVTITVFNVGRQTIDRWNSARERRVERAVIDRQWHQLQDALERIPIEGYDQVVVIGEEELSQTHVEVEGRGAAAPGREP